MLRKAGIDDIKTVADLAILMWEEHTVEDLVEEFSELLKSDEAQIFLKMDGNEPVGFAQCQLRHDYVEGTETSPIGYLEGIFVKKEYQHKGYAKELLAACEKWAVEMGCTEFASDCELDNLGSLKFHLKMGFEEANRIICFTKKL